MLHQNRRLKSVSVTFLPAPITALPPLARAPSRTTEISAPLPAFIACSYSTNQLYTFNSLKEIIGCHCVACASTSTCNSLNQHVVVHVCTFNGIDIPNEPAEFCAVSVAITTFPTELVARFYSWLSCSRVLVSTTRLLGATLGSCSGIQGQRLQRRRALVTVIASSSSAVPE